MMAIRLGNCFILGFTLLLSISSSPGWAESLEEAWKAALAANPQLQAVKRTTASSQETLDATKATRLPNLTAAGGYTILDNEPAMALNIRGLPVKDLPFAGNRFFAGNVTASLPLFTSGRISRGIEAASASMNAARMEEARASMDLKIKVAEIYIQILQATRNLRVAETHVASLSAHARDVENLFQQGFVARNDLLAARVALADARQKAIQAQNGLDLARAAYNRLLDRPLTQRVELEDLAVESFENDVEALTNRALEKRAELAAMTNQAQGLRHQAASIRGGLGPQVALSGGYNYLQDRYLVRDGFWSVMLGVKWELFDGGTRYHQALALEQKAEGLTKMRADLASSIALQVRQAWLDADETRRRITVAQDVVAQAEENLKVTQDRYRYGLGTQTEVLDAETMRVRSQSNYDNALYQAVWATMRLRYAAGEL